MSESKKSTAQRSNAQKLSAATEAASRKSKSRKSKRSFKLYFFLIVAIVPILACAYLAVTGSKKAKKASHRKTRPAPSAPARNAAPSKPLTDRGPDATYAPMMEAFDIDKDGKISFAEMDRAGKSAEERQSDAVRGWEDAMREADLDKDAHLSREEIVKFMNDLSLMKMAQRFGQQQAGVAGPSASSDSLARILLEPEELRNPKGEAENESEAPEEENEGMQNLATNRLMPMNKQGLEL
mmetsp:Transcript_126183/g.229039  ORF Transcript_126183/g.229039 Transcript_126183/m.229039 type:complete len:239 (-) Transcript_126183:129-845(-)